MKAPKNTNTPEEKSKLQSILSDIFFAMGCLGLLVLGLAIGIWGFAFLFIISKMPASFFNRLKLGERIWLCLIITISYFLLIVATNAFFSPIFAGMISDNSHEFKTEVTQKTTTLASPSPTTNSPSSDMLDKLGELIKPEVSCLDLDNHQMHCS